VRRFSGCRTRCGAHVGSQADAWKDKRRERIGMRTHLEQLYADFEFSDEPAARAAAHHEELTNDLIFATCFGCPTASE
jgi:hypothetical protein